MKYAVISSATIAAAGGNLSPHAYLDNPCARCGHGKGQHHPLQSAHRSQRRHDSTGCTHPGCDCIEYVGELEASYYGA